MTELTQIQESVARSWADPDCVLTADELAETAGCCLRSAAAELRSRARYFDSFYRQPGDPYGSALEHIVNHLRARADDLDGGVS